MRKMRGRKDTWLENRKERGNEGSDRRIVRSHDSAEEACL